MQDIKTHNLPELSVTELSFALKKTVESSFERVRVRGEISGLKIATSGHLYCSLKDEQSVISAICWRGSLSKLSAKPEEGLEVICTGKLTTFPGRSQYQIVIDQMEVAGEGALLKLLEERKKKLASEGLFNSERKKPIPFLPKVIGVVTSPTGAVIRDIMHRITDRFPRYVLLWGTPVQGEEASGKIASAIKGFNSINPKKDNVPKPDVIIVARGGGSLEDLWCFNEEEVVRAVAESEIPIISAVGHETDTMLIDYAADLRAPTPTGAAEKAVPVRVELLSQTKQNELRLTNGLHRFIEENKTKVKSAGRGIPNIENLLLEHSQKIDDRAERLQNSIKNFTYQQKSKTENLGASLKSPKELLSEAELKLNKLYSNIDNVWFKSLNQKENHLTYISSGLNFSVIKKEIKNEREKTIKIAERLKTAYERTSQEQEKNLKSFSERLENCSFKKTLERGFAIIRDHDGNIVSSKSNADNKQNLSIEFEDGSIDVYKQTKMAKKPSTISKKICKNTKQGSLF